MYISPDIDCSDPDLDEDFLDSCAQFGNQKQKQQVASNPSAGKKAFLRLIGPYREQVMLNPSYNLNAMHDVRFKREALRNMITFNAANIQKRNSVMFGGDSPKDLKDLVAKTSKNQKAGYEKIDHNPRDLFPDDIIDSTLAQHPGLLLHYAEDLKLNREDTMRAMKDAAEHGDVAVILSDSPRIPENKYLRSLNIPSDFYVEVVNLIQPKQLSGGAPTKENDAQQRYITLSTMQHAKLISADVVKNWLMQLPPKLIQSVADWMDGKDKSEITKLIQAMKAAGNYPTDDQIDADDDEDNDSKVNDLPAIGQKKKKTPFSSFN